jgi:hypothetical protein
VTICPNFAPSLSHHNCTIRKLTELASSSVDANVLPSYFYGHIQFGQMLAPHSCILPLISFPPAGAPLICIILFIYLPPPSQGLPIPNNPLSIISHPPALSSAAYKVTSFPPTAGRKISTRCPVNSFASAFFSNSNRQICGWFVSNLIENSYGNKMSPLLGKLSHAIFKK